jgi:type IV secretion system T-DNA border endonuclease VirD1
MTNDDKSGAPWKSRRMESGDWTDDAKSDKPQRVEKPVSVKLTEAELAEFDEAIARLGLKRNRALRIAARRIAGFVEADVETLAVLKDMSAQLSGIARNVNQIARAANRTHDPDYRAFMEERRDLGKQLARVEGQMRKFMDTAQRRSDGEARLKKAMKQ